MDARDQGTTARWLPLAGSVAASLLGCLLVAALPRFVGVSWPAVGSAITAVPATVLLALVCLWFAGLLVHAPVLMAAMPGLSVRQALSLNLSGSAVSNVVPLGGPVGMGLGFAMARSWGFSSERFASYTVATNLWNALGKFTMALCLLAGAAAFGVGLPSGLGPIVASASFFIALAAGGAVAVFRSKRSTTAAGDRLDRCVAALRRRDPDGACGSWLLDSRTALLTAVGAGWMRMSVGVLTYLALQAALLYACLTAVGAGVSPRVVLVAFAIERLISLAPLTPGASGIAELGTVAALHSFGVDPVSAAAGVLLYRILMFAIEIPVGGAIAIGWLHRHRGARTPGGNPRRHPARVVPVGAVGAASPPRPEETLA